jgi:hypothetical protein
MLDAYPPDLREFVAQKIAAGEFKSAEEFAVQAAELYRELDRRQADLKRSVEEGLAQIESGDYIELNGDEELREFFEGVKRRGRELLARQSQ